MLHALLVLAAVGSVALGIHDLVRTSSDVAAPAVSSTDCPPGAQRRFVKINASAQPAALVAYRGAGEPGGTGQPVVLLALDAPHRHAIVRMAPADAHGRLVNAAPWRGGPVSGLLVPLPAGMAPMQGHERFPSSVTVSWLQFEYEPTLAFPIAFTAGGAVWLGLLCWVLSLARPKKREDGAEQPLAEPPDARTPYLTVPPTTMKRLVLVAAAIAAVGGAYVVRRDRLGDPKVFESPLLPLVAHAAAIGLGFLYFKRTSDGAVVCLGGVMVSEDRFVRWDQVKTLTRESGSGYTLVLETQDGESVRLELGGGGEGARQASAIATFARPAILAALRELILVGKEVEFGQIRLASDSIGWELATGWRMSEFDDVEKIKVADGKMTIKLLASEFDDVVFPYQQAPNGFLLPLLIAGGKHSGRSTCKMSFRAPDAAVDPFLGPPLTLSGGDAWIAHIERDVADALVKQAQSHVATAQASSARGGATAALAHVTRALALFEAAGRSDPPEVRGALLALGHAMLETKQPTPARHAYERAFRLLEADRSSSVLDVGRARHGLAVARWQCKDSTGGLADARRATELLAKGAPLAELAIAFNTLAGLERAEGHGDEAQDALEKLLQRLEHASNEELADLGPARLLAFMQNATLVLAPLEEPAVLAKAYARGVELMRRTAGPEALLVGQGLFSLGQTQLAARNAAAAAESFEAALAIFESHLGEQHAWMAGCLDRLGEAYWYSGARDQAQNAWELAAGVPGAKAANA
jgi:hypothetical protein